MSAPLDGATAVVTGASRGIGRAVARALAAAGARVGLVARGRAPLEQLAAELGSGSFAVPCDVRDAGSVSRATAHVTATLGGPPLILVNSAGTFHLRPFEDLAVDEFASMAEVNLIAPFRFIRAFLPAMRAAGTGHIVTVGSAADRSAWPGNAGYAASKYGARAMHEVLRAETRGSGVHASLVSPGPTDTGLWDGLDPDARPDLPDRAAMLRAEDVAGAVLYAVTRPASVNVDELRLSRA